MAVLFCLLLVDLSIHVIPSEFPRRTCRLICKICRRYKEWVLIDTFQKFSILAIGLFWRPKSVSSWPGFRRTRNPGRRTTMAHMIWDSPPPDRPCHVFVSCSSQHCPKVWDLFRPVMMRTVSGRHVPSHGPLDAIAFLKIFPGQLRLLYGYHPDINAQPNRCITIWQVLKVALIW